MTPGKVSHCETLLAALGDSDDAKRFTAARSLLRRQLVMARETPIGRDYLFAGGQDDLRRALKDLVAVEHRLSRMLQFDYAPLSGYFLLRIVGAEDQRSEIAHYFEED
jgi:hypothetical protein